VLLGLPFGSLSLPQNGIFFWFKDSVSGIQYIGVKVFASLISNYFDFVK